MIIDDIKNFETYLNLHKRFKDVFKFMRENKLSDLKKGCYEIDGKNLYVNIDEYQTKTDSIPEAHREYIDIQIVLSGNEKIGYANYSNGTTEITYNAEKDIEFLKADCEYIKANNKKFFIFFPQDIHHPCITDEKPCSIKKAVFKIKIK